MKRSDKAINEILRSFRELNPKAEKCLIACSGGADSVALVFALSKIKKDFPIAVGHITHDIRPVEETDKDKKCVEELCKRLDIEFRHSKCYPADRKIEYNGIEDAARFLRYTSLSKLTLKGWDDKERYTGILDCHFIATAHHADDQLETMLMRIGRGCGINGFVGIYEKTEGYQNPSIIRPMLNLCKEDCVSICLDNNLQWVEDSTNQDINYTRNRIRKEIIPILRELYPQVARHATELSRTVKSANDLIDRILIRDLSMYQNDWHFYDNRPCELNIHAAIIVEDVVLHNWIREAFRHTYKSGPVDINYKIMNNIVKAVKSKKRKKYLIDNRVVVETTADHLIIRQAKNDDLQKMQKQESVKQDAQAN